MNGASGTLWVGVDIGGTFTDVVIYDDAARRLRTVKTPSVREDLSRGILEGLEKADTPLSSVSRLVHGTTIATNTILEKKGARTAVVTTQGFRDVLELGLGNRMVLYQLKYQKPRGRALRRAGWRRSRGRSPPRLPAPLGPNRPWAPGR